MTVVQPSSRLPDYLLILESASIPEKPLPPRSRQTPEWELVEEIREAFGIPATYVKRSQLAAWLAANVTFDDFMIFFINLARSFVLMARDIYEFLAVARKTMGTAKGVEKILCRDQSEFPFDTRSFEPLQQMIEATASISSWNLGMLSTLINSLEPAADILACPDHPSSARCPHRHECSMAGRTILGDLASLREALRMFIDNPDGHPIPLEDHEVEGMGRYGHPWVSIDRAAAILRTIEQTDTTIKQSYGVSFYCLPTQDRYPFQDLWTTVRLQKLSNMLQAAKEIHDTKIQILCDFFQLPYWRQRNDLFEVWTLVQACTDLSDIRLGCLDPKGHWKIPGNQQGSLDEPILSGVSTRGVWKVFTGVRITNYQFDFERPSSGFLRKKAPADAMPDWLFCRHDGGRMFDYNLMAGAAAEFRSRSLVPELVIECKAGASYGLIETVFDPMEARYASLLRTPEGRGILVNYRLFRIPKDFLDQPDLQKIWLTRFSRSHVIAPLFPGNDRQTDTFQEALRTVLCGCADTVRGADIIIAVDTTGSMHSHLGAIMTQLRTMAFQLLNAYPGTRIGLGGIGDHNEEIEPFWFGGMHDRLEDLEGAIEILPHTGGGDEPEAYEDALHFCTKFDWRANVRKFVVIVGDAPPHMAKDCPQGYDWQSELGTLAALGIRVIGLHHGDDPQAAKFFNECAKLTSGTIIPYSSTAMENLTEMFEKEMAPG